MNLEAAVHEDLAIALNRIYTPCGFDWTSPLAEPESAEYGAYRFAVNGRSALFRVAKITPTKTGQFVTLWKRSSNGPIEPYSISDPIDLVIISVKEGNKFGQFIFPKAVLVQKGIVSSATKAGKRAIRVYPPWSQTNSKQAQQTQHWQLEFFLEINKDGSLDIKRAQQLFNL